MTAVSRQCFREGRVPRERDLGGPCLCQWKRVWFMVFSQAPWCAGLGVPSACWFCSPRSLLGGGQPHVPRCQPLLTVLRPPQLTWTRRQKAGVAPAPVATPPAWPGARPAPRHPPKHRPPPRCPLTCHPSTRLAATCWAPVWSVSECLCTPPNRANPPRRHRDAAKQSPQRHQHLLLGSSRFSLLGEPGPSWGRVLQTHDMCGLAETSPRLGFGEHHSMSYWVLASGDGVRRGVRGERDCSHPRSSQDCWEPCRTAGAPHRGVCPAAAGPSGRCGTRCGGCSGGWRRACAAPAAIPREKPPRPGGSWWPADRRPPRTQHPRGRWHEGRGAVGVRQQPPLVGGSTVSHGPGDTPSPSHFCCNWGEVGLGEGDQQPGCAGWWVGGMPEGTLGGPGGDSSTVPSTGSQAPRCGAGWPLGSR